MSPVVQTWEESQEFLRTQLFRNQAQHRIVDTTDKFFMFHKPELLETPLREAIKKWREQKGLA